MKTYDVAVVGGGIVGLATAWQLLEKDPALSVVLLEKEAEAGAHQTGHNSGVIHSGLYYKPGSEKAKTCVEGGRLLVEFCRAHEVPHEICGKLVVATSEEELPRLFELVRRGRENGVAGVREMEPAEFRKIEPHAAGVRALHVPPTGITDYGLVARTFAALLSKRGADVRFRAKVTAFASSANEVNLVAGGEEVAAKHAVNCSGLHADRGHPRRGPRSRRSRRPGASPAAGRLARRRLRARAPRADRPRPERPVARGDGLSRDRRPHRRGRGRDARLTRPAGYPRPFMASRYFTTPIYYVNDRPHIGHLYTTVVTDTLARYFRQKGEDVRFVTGTDEHGQNIERVAKKEGVAPIVVADRHAPTFRNLWKEFGISNDDFIRTTEPRHWAGVEEIIRRIEAAGDFYTAGHEGWYCGSCEAFYPEKDLVEGNCPVHGFKTEWQREENVFFRLSKYGPRLLELFEEGVEGRPFVFPESRLNEVRSFVESGLKDLSVSRTTITWGIPFPGRSGHVVYVWLDALVNYITALGFGSHDLSLYERYWPGIHVIGKDILRFHAVYWPAFLMSAGLPIPRQVVSHGWWLRDAKKMSKSTGNVVRPDELVAAFGVDALRWHLVSAMSFGQDANFSDEDFLAGYNADLANGLGNTLSRAVKMASDAFGGKTPAEMCDDNEVRSAAIDAVAAWTSAFESYRLQDAAAALRSLVTRIDGYIAAKEPWKKVKAEGVTPALHRIHYGTLEGLRVAACMLAPIAPRTATEVFRRLGIEKKAEDVRESDLAWGGLPLNAPLPQAPPLFPRADAKEYFASKEKNVEEEKDKMPSKGVSQASPAAISQADGTSAPAPSPAAGGSTGEEKIPISDFLKLDLRVGEVLAAEKVEKSKKLMKMTVRIGEETRSIVGGIALAYTAEQLVGKKFVFVANLAPAKLMGIESNGMILAATLPETGEPSLLMVDPSVPSGAKVK